MIAKVIGVLLIAWGILMAALSIASLVFMVMGGGDLTGLECVGGQLLIGIGATYAGHQLYHREAKKPEE